jgi:LacI family transcriptional regulator/LacI family repressor for deo operon, udp, cdd, tsx, nupC, and nupG
VKPVSGSSQSRSATIRDVAASARVSVATVSRVINDSARVNPDTRARVLAAIEDLDFRRSSTARNLSIGRSHGIGVIAPFFTTPSVVERLRGVVGGLARRGYDLLLFDIEAPEHRADALRDFARRDRLDGLIVISLPLSDGEVERLGSDGLPVVLVDVAHPRLQHFTIDDVDGGRVATEHLLAKGHRRIGFIGDLPENPFGFTSSEHRLRGYELALRAAGIEPAEDLVQLGPYGLDEARPLAEALLRREDRPTAIFAASDMQAVGVLRCARALGLRVPEDIAVIGFDDIDVADILELTTVRQPLRESGARAAEALLLAIEERAQPARPLEQLVVVERATT